METLKRTICSSTYKKDHKNAIEKLEQKLAAMLQEHSVSAEIRLGEVLAKRCIKPGQVVQQWSTSRGQHAGELSKKEFRVAVQGLGLANAGVSETDIDDVFDKFDEVSRPPLPPKAMRTTPSVQSISGLAHTYTPT